MILSCDPPRHAFLVHFGKRQQPGPLHTLQSEHHGARVQIALNRQSVPHSLVAVHFVRHGFRLPFVGSRDHFSTNHFHIRSGRRQNQYFFFFSSEPRDRQEWHAAVGLTVLMSEPPPTGSDSKRSVEHRPLLHGMLVDLEVLQVDVDMSEFVFEFGADNLKDVPVTLFVERPGA
jgi:hypothetical protein